VLCGHKVMPPALEAIIKDGRAGLDGFILPAHVSAIIGSRPYEFISERYGIPGAIAGFEPLDIMQGIGMLIKQISGNKPRIEIQYDRVVHPSGNKPARGILKEVFETSDAEWRGLGVIPDSGFLIKDRFAKFDAEKNIKLKLPGRKKIDKGCICGEVLKGLKTPKDCGLFSKACTPEHPVGACMVSSEGTCSAYYLHSYIHK
jgi:hydrogenase expression/formation protein HypD